MRYIPKMSKRIEIEGKRFNRWLGSNNKHYLVSDAQMTCSEIADKLSVSYDKARSILRSKNGVSKIQGLINEVTD